MFWTMSRMSWMSNEAILKCEARLFVSFCFFSSVRRRLFVVCGQFALHIAEFKERRQTTKYNLRAATLENEVTKKKIWFTPHQDGRTPWYTYNKAFLICIFYCLLISEYVLRRLICLNNIKKELCYLEWKNRVWESENDKYAWEKVVCWIIVWNKIFSCSTWHACVNTYPFNIHKAIVCHFD